jgi:hypothetical protein
MNTKRTTAILFVTGLIVGRVMWQGPMSTRYLHSEKGMTL